MGLHYGVCYAYPISATALGSQPFGIYSNKIYLYIRFNGCQDENNPLERGPRASLIQGDCLSRLSYLKLGDY